jgi:hypothetical protein
MKSSIQHPASSLVALLLALSLVLGFTGCAHVADGEDPFVVRTEQTIDGAFATVDAFVAHEHQFRDWYRENAPQVHAFAETELRRKIQPTGERRFEALTRNARGALETYKVSVSAENATAVNVAVDVLTDLATRAATYQLIPE